MEKTPLPDILILILLTPPPPAPTSLIHPRILIKIISEYLKSSEEDPSAKYFWSRRKALTIFSPWKYSTKITFSEEIKLITLSQKGRSCRKWTVLSWLTCITLFKRRISSIWWWIFWMEANFFIIWGASKGFQKGELNFTLPKLFSLLKHSTKKELSTET